MAIESYRHVEHACLFHLKNLNPWLHKFCSFFNIFKNEGSRGKRNKWKILFFLYSLHFFRFFKMNISGLIYMSIPFHSPITHQNWLKNNQTRPKGSKITHLGLDAKGNKNWKIQNKHKGIFWHIFKGKKNYSNRTTRSTGFGGGYLLGRHYNVSVPVYSMNSVFFCHQLLADIWSILGSLKCPKI